MTKERWIHSLPRHGNGLSSVQILVLIERLQKWTAVTRGETRPEVQVRGSCDDHLGKDEVIFYTLHLHEPKVNENGPSTPRSFKNTLSFMKRNRNQTQPANQVGKY